MAVVRLSKIIPGQCLAQDGLKNSPSGSCPLLSLGGLPCLPLGARQCFLHSILKLLPNYV